MRKTFVLAALVVTLLIAHGLRAAELAGGRPPNFVVVFCDNLGYGDIEPFGSQVHQTPHLNRMAREGRKFTHFCVTAGVCTPSRASLMTGCYAQRVGMAWNERDGGVLFPVSPYGLNTDEMTIAEVLKGRGYATAIIGKWHLGDQPAFLPTRQGFDYFFGIPYSDDMTLGLADEYRRRRAHVVDRLDVDRWPPLPLLEGESVIEAPPDRNELTKRYTKRALRWIEDHRDEPFFLYLPQAMPGSTMVPFASAAFRGKSKNGPWGDSIEELDWSQGEILNKLVELGIDKHTLVIWTSDNGSPMKDDPQDISRGTNAPLFGRGYTTAEGGFRVPTIMWWPGTIPAGTTCTELCTTMDLLPTFARLAGGSPPRDRALDGYDIRPLIVGEKGAQTPYEVFYYYRGDQLQAVRSGPWKLFLPLQNPTRHPHFQGPGHPLLFNVVEDIGCRMNVADEHPTVVGRLNDLAARARAELGDHGQPGSGKRKLGRVTDRAPLRMN